MKFTVLSLFPEFFSCYDQFGIIRRALEDKRFSLEVRNIRDYSTDKHRRVDDYPYAGGSGMVMTPQPLADSLAGCKHVVYLSPRGEKLSQDLVKELAELDEMTLLCGHYEGIDQRIIDSYVEREISIGDYILSGGEIPALVLMDAIIRLLPGVITEDSLLHESHNHYLLEYDQYTRPEHFAGQAVPEVLLSGNHAQIEAYRMDQAIRLTLQRRPDLIDEGLRQGAFDKKQIKRIHQLREEEIS